MQSNATWQIQMPVVLLETLTGMAIIPDVRFRFTGLNLLTQSTTYRWKIQEACLMAVGRTSEELIQGLQDKETPASFDLAGLFEHVVLENMKLTRMY
jgi:hypothetical protein